jgi:hypothetical protein
LELPLSVAVSIAVCAALTADAVAVKPALVAPPAIVTDVGTFTALLLLATSTVIPLPPAAAVSVTLHASVPAPVSVPVLHVTALSSSRDDPPPRLSRCCPNIVPGMQHNIVTTAAKPNIRKQEIPLLLCAVRTLKGEGWLQVNASSAATVRPKGRGIRFEYIQCTCKRQGTRHLFARAMLLPRRA